MRSMIIIQPAGAPLITGAALASAAEREFGEIATAGELTDRNADMQVLVRPPDEPAFTIRHFADDAMLSLDGTPEQNARTAAWLRSVMPAGLDVYAVDGSGSEHAYLPPGITAEQIPGSWVDGLPTVD